MRFFFCALIWLVIVGGLWSYTGFRDAGLSKTPPVARAVQQVVGHFSLEITPTFSIEKDPFALQTDHQAPASFEVRLNGERLDVPQEGIKRGEVIKIPALSRLLVGFNEIYVKGSPPVAESSLSHGLRVVLTDRGHLVVDRTIWGGDGTLVSGTINFKFSPVEEGGHDH